MSESTPLAPEDLPASRGRLPAAEVRRRMIQQGHHVIRERGLTVGLDDIRMEDLIAAAQVPRSSVWRLWTSKAEYSAELISTAVDPDGADLRRANFDPTSRDVAVEMLGTFEGRLGTPEERRAALCELTRVLTRRNVERLVASPAWRTYSALLATAPAVTPTEARARLVGRLEEAEAQYHDAMTTFYETVFPRLGLRLRRPEYTYRHLAVAGAGVVEGLALRGVLASLATDDSAPVSAVAHPLAATLAENLPGPGEGEWGLVALAVMGVVDAFVEPDPDGPRG
ncbi:hypothetical protein Q9R32_09500 [Actinotalea sp. AC32]|nr:hypothetical protein [Actinotalea sp. AC32]